TVSSRPPVERNSTAFRARGAQAIGNVPCYLRSDLKNIEELFRAHVSLRPACAFASPRHRRDPGPGRAAGVQPRRAAAISTGVRPLLLADPGGGGSRPTAELARGLRRRAPRLRRGDARPLSRRSAGELA